MKNILFLLCFIAGNAYSQSVTKEDVIGVWVCKHVALSKKEPMTPEQKAMADKVKGGFVAGRFTFGTNGLFEMELPQMGPELATLAEGMTKKPWVLSNNRIFISPKENLGSFSVTKEGGLLIFTLDETPFVLTMEKMQ